MWGITAITRGYTKQQLTKIVTGILDIRPHNRYVSHMFHKDDIGVTVEKKFMYISFNFKIITQRT